MALRPDGSGTCLSYPLLPQTLLLPQPSTCSCRLPPWRSLISPCLLLTLSLLTCAYGGPLLARDLVSGTPRALASSRRWQPPICGLVCCDHSDRDTQKHDDLHERKHAEERMERVLRWTCQKRPMRSAALGIRSSESTTSRFWRGLEAKPIWSDSFESDSSPTYELDTEEGKSLRAVDSLQ